MIHNRFLIDFRKNEVNDRFEEKCDGALGLCPSQMAQGTAQLIRKIVAGQWGYWARACNTAKKNPSEP